MRSSIINIGRRLARYVRDVFIPAPLPKIKHASPRHTRRIVSTPDREEQMCLALDLRDVAMENVERNSGDRFQTLAANFTLFYLAANGSATGEDITDSAKKNGIIPHDDRAFGPVYMRLYKLGHIVPVGNASRRKGHGSLGARIWILTNAELIHGDAKAGKPRETLPPLDDAAC